MRRTNLLALLALAVLAVLAAASQADALSSLRAYKLVTITINVTPSPTPMAFARPAPPAARPAAQNVARLVTDPAAGARQVALGATLWDVAPRSVIAQSQAQASPVPVQFVAKADPNAAYLKVVAGSGGTNLSVPYGTTTVVCAFQIYTYYATAHTLNDWGFQTTSSGSGAFPIENAPTASYLAWSVPDFSTTVHNYANGGGPGEKTWSGTAGQAQQHCINLTITVPASQASGMYQAVIEYALYVT